MKTTIDLPDDLYRQVKARAALEGRSVREVTTALYVEWLAGTPEPPEPGREEWLARWRRISAAEPSLASD